ncbi:MAG TPA: phosphoenolpyruvate carboxylase [Steroidobacteraceae bacterium]|nr:phosphoenolpyruvate carboxylase [Steroidobacteraceae bacterium]
MIRQRIQFQVKDEALREDVHALGATIGEILREQGGDELFDLVEGDRVAAIRLRNDAAAGSVELERRVEGRSPGSAADLTRAFSLWFQAVNTAEKVHRVRRRRDYLQDAAFAQPGGIADSIARLRAEGLSLEAMLRLIGSMSIEPVFTAHPSESTRRTILRKQQRTAQYLLDRRGSAKNAEELVRLDARVRMELTTIWQTEEHPRELLTVAEEREHLLFYLVDILYRIVPLFYEEIAQALAHGYGVSPDGIEVPDILRFGSWVGGDMDGNPDVHGKTIRDTLQRHRRVAVSTYFDECRQIARSLSQSARRVSISAALQDRLDAYALVLPTAQSLAPARRDRMPYREFFNQVGERLKATYEARPNGYQSADELLADVSLAADSLVRHRGRHAGYFLVRRLIRRVRTFGFYLASLDVLQHAGVHDRVIAQGLARPDWLQLPPEQRLVELRDLLARDQGPRAPFDAVGRRTLAVFDAIARARHQYGERAIGQYVVTGARGPQDVLAVLLLARWGGMTDARTGQCPLDVAPSLESLDALNDAGAIIGALQREPAYAEHLRARGGRQTVLIGYSDSNKQGGIAASRWALQVAQRQLLEAARSAGFELTIFHARGGTAARGGGRTEHLVESVPPGAVRGVLRTTEQGESVNRNYGLRPLAMRTLERSFAAVAIATARADAPSEVPAAQRAAMQAIADTSLAAYRALVYEEPGFYEYFRAATPLDAIERMSIGARDANRGEGAALETLRPIPWVFAWTQSRHLLPGWFGFGSGLEAAIAAHGAGVLREMLAGWPFFAHLFGDVEATLARTDLAIAARYEELAGDAAPPYARQIGAEFARSAARVLELRGYAQLLDRDATLQRAIRLRNPYIDPMHLMQVDLLRRWRASQRRDPDLLAALRATISGIAQGMQATG